MLHVFHVQNLAFIKLILIFAVLEHWLIQHETN